MNTSLISVRLAVLAAVALFCLPVNAQFGPPGGGGDRGSRGGGGFDRGGGGDRGSRGGGGDRGGFRGSSGGAPDPSAFLSRLDRNGNGTIDPDEQQGPAQFLIQRMQSADPSIKAGQPISVKRVTEAFQKMREGRDSGGSNDSRRSSGGSSEEGLEAEMLVPGFGVESELPPLTGFGPAAEMMLVVVTDDDKRSAGELLRRYDRNKDSALSKDEISSRFAGNPMDFDRNKDGRLTQGELAVRVARRRESAESSKDSGKDKKRSRSRESDNEPPDVFNGRKSYRRMGGSGLPEGVPGFFTEKDEDKDGQVTMEEFTEKWDDTLLAEFFKSDLNRDGIITVDESIRAIEEASQASTSSSGATAKPSNVGTVDEKTMRFAKIILGRADKNKDSQLTASEWSKMLVNPAKADANADGIITVKEYAWWMKHK